MLHLPTELGLVLLRSFLRGFLFCFPTISYCSKRIRTELTILGNRSLTTGQTADHEKRKPTPAGTLRLQSGTLLHRLIAGGQGLQTSFVAMAVERTSLKQEIFLGGGGEGSFHIPPLARLFERSFESGGGLTFHGNTYET